MAFIKKHTRIADAVEDVEELSYLLVGIKLVQLLWKTVWRFFKALLNRTAIGSAVHYWYRPKNGNQYTEKEILHSMLTAARYSLWQDI